MIVVLLVFLPLLVPYIGDVRGYARDKGKSDGRDRYPGRVAELGRVPTQGRQEKWREVAVRVVERHPLGT